MSNSTMKINLISRISLASQDLFLKGIVELKLLILRQLTFGNYFVSRFLDGVTFLTTLALTLTLQREALRGDSVTHQLTKTWRKDLIRTTGSYDSSYFGEGCGNTTFGEPSKSNLNLQMFKSFNLKHFYYWRFLYNERFRSNIL